MANKRLTKIALLPLLLSLGMTACSSDEIIAKPSNYNDNIVIGGDSQKLEDVYRNINKIIADAYHDGGSFQGDVLDKVLYEYSVSVFGYYNKLKAPEGSTAITLKAAAADAASVGGDHSVAKQFINTYKSYQSNPRNDAEELARVISKWETIEERIAERMYEKVSGGTYSDRSVFSEKKFVQSLQNDMMAVKLGTTYEGLILPSVEPKEVFTKEIEIEPGKTATLLNRANYQFNYKLGEDETAATTGKKARYIEDELIADIYDELLVEQYILNESYNVLGRSNARKVNVISFTGDSTNITAAKNIANGLINRIFTSVNKVTVGTTADVGPSVSLDDMKVYSNIWAGALDTETIAKQVRGADGATTYGAIANEAFGAQVSSTKDASIKYWKGTAFGKVIEDYDKITDDPYTNDTSIESTFTNSGAYTVETGLQIKTNEILLKDYTTAGWSIKNGGLTELPETIRTRLYNIAVAGAIPEEGSNQSNFERAKVDTETNTITYTVSKDESSYVACVNGKYYLKTGTHMQGSDAKNDILFFESSSNTYYIVQIEEASSTAKFSKGDYGYKADKLTEVENAIVKLVAKTESYQTLAKKHWIEKMGVESEKMYHDQSILDYFKTNYPDLFD